MTLALDCAASEFYKDGKYDLAGEGKVFDSNGFSDFLKSLTEQYPIVLSKMAWMSLIGMAGLTRPRSLVTRSSWWVMTCS